MRRILFFILSSLLIVSCALEDPLFMTIEAHSDPERIIIDEKYTSIDQIKEAINAKTKDLDSLQRSKFFVKLKFSEETTMGIANDIRQLLRESNVLNVRYYHIKPSKKASM